MFHATGAAGCGGECVFVSLKRTSPGAAWFWSVMSPRQENLQFTSDERQPLRVSFSDAEGRHLVARRAIWLVASETSRRLKLLSFVSQTWLGRTTTTQTSLVVRPPFHRRRIRRDPPTDREARRGRIPRASRAAWPNEREVSPLKTGKAVRKGWEWP